jgi:hypothetical protein
LIHDPESIALAFLQDEREGAATTEKPITQLLWTDFQNNVGNIEVTFLTPSGWPITIDGNITKCLVCTDSNSNIFINEDGSVNVDINSNEPRREAILSITNPGAIYGFVVNNEEWIAVCSEHEFKGFYNKNKQQYYEENRTLSISKASSYWVKYWNGGRIVNRNEQWQGTWSCLNINDGWKNLKEFNPDLSKYRAAGPFESDPISRIEQTCNIPNEVRIATEANYAAWLYSENVKRYIKGGILFKYKLYEQTYVYLYCDKPDDESTPLVYYMYNPQNKDWKIFEKPEFNDDTFNNLIAIGKHYGHETLDIIGFIPVIGEFADAFNGLCYIVEGDKLNATLCFASCSFPLVADIVVKGSIYTVKAVKGVALAQPITLLGENFARLARISDVLKVGKKGSNAECFNLISKMLGELAEHAETIELLAKKITDTDKLKAVLSKIDNLGESKSLFLADLKQADNLPTNALANNVHLLDEGMIESWKVLADAGVDNAIRTNSDKISKVDKYLDNNPSMKEGFIDDLKNTSDPDKFIDRTSWRDDIVQQYGVDVNQFKPQGLSKTDISQSTYDDMLNASNAPSDIKDGIVDDLIKSGSTPPVKENVKVGDELYKITPKGEGVTDFSPYWTTKAELDNLRAAGDLEQKLGLPINSHAVEYDVFKITATKDVDVFTSTIAPTLQNGYNTIGGATQTLVLDRSAWSVATKVEIFIP